jgi:hypothetical protein
MRFIRYLGKYKVDIAFLALIAIFGYIYFVVYLTPDRITWYDAMFNQAHDLFDLFIKFLLKFQKL